MSTTRTTKLLWVAAMAAVGVADPVGYQGICSLSSPRNTDCVVCHVTGSNSNPWEIVLPDYNGWRSGHAAHTSASRHDFRINPGVCVRGIGHENDRFTTGQIAVRKDILKQCCNSGEGGGDPWLSGFNGQKYFFDGEDTKWYNAISDPMQRLNMNMRIASYPGSESFIDGLAVSVMGADGQEHNIAVSVGVDKNNFAPQCPKGEVCLGDGAVRLEIDGEVISKPGDTVLEPGFEIAAVNAPFYCKKVPDAHFHWAEQVAHMHDHSISRNLEDRDLLAVVSSVDGLWDEDKCQEWVAERREAGDVLQQMGRESTILINTPQFSLRVEYTMNTDEANWIKHHRFDWFLTNYAPSRTKGAVGGVLGETAVLTYDQYGMPIMGDRAALLSFSDDAAYEVSGPFGKTFLAQA